MGTKENRIFKVNWLLSTINEAGRAGLIVNKEKLLAEFALFFGSTRRTGLEILKVIEIAGKILITDKNVWSKKAWEAEQVLNKAKENSEGENKKGDQDNGKN